jgi:hypothetical protein
MTRAPEANTMLCDPLKLLLISWAALTLLASGCGDPSAGVSEDIGPDACVSGCDDVGLLAALPGSTLISSLSKSELVAFCEHREAFYQEFLALQTDPALNCTAQGLDLRFEEGLDIAACEAERSACIEEASNLPTTSFALLACLPYQVSSTEMTECALSLSQYNACTDAQLEQAEALITALSCTITPDEAARFRAQEHMAMPAACDVVAEQCPPIQAEFDAPAE